MELERETILLEGACILLNRMVLEPLNPRLDSVSFTLIDQIAINLLSGDICSITILNNTPAPKVSLFAQMIWQVRQQSKQKTCNFWQRSYNRQHHIRVSFHMQM